MSTKELVAIAREQVGATEEGGNNLGPTVREYQGATWLAPGQWPWCLAGDVELLTEVGWVPFALLRADHGKVAQVDPLTLGVSFVTPTSYIRKPYVGDVTRVRTRSLDFRCDPEHRFFGRWHSRSTQNEARPIRDMSNELVIPACQSTQPGSNLLDEHLDFLAAFLSDGFFHQRSDQHAQRVRIQVSKARKVERLHDLAPIGTYKQARAYGSSKQPLTCFEYLVPAFFHEVFDGYKSVRWTWALSLSAAQCRYFVERYMFWDGTVSRRTISTSRKQNCDVLVALAALAGFIPSVRVRAQEGRKLNYTISLGRSTRTLTTEHITSDYDETDLFCVTVPTGLILVRDAGGSPFVTGNCAAFTCWTLREWLQLEEGRAYMRAFNIVEAGAWRCKDASAFGWEDWAQQKGLQILRPPAKPRPGDFVIYDFNGPNQGGGHIGIVESVVSNTSFVAIEGNTGIAGARDSNEGDGVLRKTRPSTLVKCYVRIEP